MADSTEDKLNTLLKEEKEETESLYDAFGIDDILNSPITTESPAKIMAGTTDTYPDLPFITDDLLNTPLLATQTEQETGGVGDLFSGVWEGIKRQGHNYLQIADFDNADIELPNQDTYWGNVGDAVGANIARLSTQIGMTVAGALTPAGPVGAGAGWYAGGSLNTWMVARETYKSLYEQAIANGASEEMARQAAYEGTVESVGFEAAANLIPVGKLGGLVKGTSTAAKVGRGALAVGAEMASEGGTEAIQQKLENEAVNRNLPFGTSIDTDEGVLEAGLTGALAAGLTKGSFDLLGGAKGIAASKLKNYVDSKTQGTSTTATPTQATKPAAQQINEATRNLSNAFGVSTPKENYVEKDKSPTTDTTKTSLFDYINKDWGTNLTSDSSTETTTSKPSTNTEYGRVLHITDSAWGERVSLDDIKANPDATYEVTYLPNTPGASPKTVTKTGEQILISGTPVKQPSFNLSKNSTKESDGTVRQTEAVGSKVGDTNVYVHQPSGKAEVQTTLEVDDSTQKTNQVAASQTNIIAGSIYSDKESANANRNLKQARMDILKARAETKLKTSKGKDAGTKEGLNYPENKQRKAKKADFETWRATETNIAATEYGNIKQQNAQRVTAAEDAELNELFVEDELEQQHKEQEIDAANKEAVLLERQAETVGGTNPDNHTLNATLAGENTVNGQPVDYATRNPERPVLTDTKTTVEQLTESAKKNVERNAMAYTRKGWKSRITKVIKALEDLPRTKTIKKAEIQDALDTLRTLHQQLSNPYIEESIDKQGVADYLSTLENVISDVRQKAELRERTKKKNAEKKVKEESVKKKETIQKEETKEEVSTEETTEEEISPEVEKEFNLEIEGVAKEITDRFASTLRYLEDYLSKYPNNPELQKIATKLTQLYNSLNDATAREDLYKTLKNDFGVIRFIQALHGQITTAIKQTVRQQNNAQRTAKLVTKEAKAESSIGALNTKEDGLKYLDTLRKQIISKEAEIPEKEKDRLLTAIAALEIDKDLIFNKKGLLKDSMREKILAIAQDPVLIKNDNVRYLQKEMPSWERPTRNAQRAIAQASVILSPKGRIGKEQVWQGVLNLAKDIGVKIYTDLDVKGISGRIPQGEMGASDIEHRIANIANSRNVEAANHELGHFMFNDGGFATGKLLPRRDFYNEMQTLCNGILFSSKQAQYIADKYDIGMLPEETFARMMAHYLTGKGYDNILNNYAPKTMEALEKFFKDNGLTDAVEQLRNTSDAYYAQGAWKQSVADFIDDPSARENIVMWVHENLYSKEGIRRQIVKICDDMAALRHLERLIEDPTRKEEVKKLIDIIDYKSQSTLSQSVAHAFLQGDGMQAGGGGIVKFKNLVQILQQIKDLDRNNADTNLRQFYSYLIAKHTVSEYVGNKEAMDRVDNLANRLVTSVDDVVFTLQNLYKYFPDLMEITTTAPQDITTLSRPGHKEGYRALNRRVAHLPSEKTLLRIINEYRKAIYEEFSPAAFRASPYYSRVQGNVTEEEAYRQTVSELYTFKNENEINDTGRTLTEALEIISDVEQDQNFVTYQNAAAEFYDWQDQLLDYISGQSAEMKFLVDRLRNSNTAYHVPLLRHFTMQERKEKLLDESGGRPYELANRTGSDRSWKNLIFSVAESMNTLIQNAHKSASYEALAMMNNYNETGHFLREIAIPKEVVEANIKDTMIAVRKATKNAAPQLTPLYDAVANDIINEVGGSVSLWAYNDHLAANEFRIYDSTEGKFRYYSTDIAIADAIRRPDFVEAAAELNKAAKMYVHYSSMVKSLMTTFNPAFVLWNNLGRDTGSLAVKGAKTGNPLIDWILPVRILYASAYQLKTVTYDWFYKKGKPFDILTQIGLYANQQHINTELQSEIEWNAKKGKAMFVGDGTIWGTIKASIKNAGTFAEMSDKTAQFSQLKWMLDTDGRHIDDIDLTRDHLTHLYASKETLRRHGITLDTVRNILTAEQIKTWGLTQGDARINLDLSDAQIQQIEQAIDWSKTNLLSEDQRIKYSKQVRNAIINFSQGGKFTRFMNHFFIFSKARTNSFIQNLTWIKKNPVLAAAYAVQMWGMGALHGLLYPDDMDDEDADELLQGVSTRIDGTKYKVRVDAMYMAPYAMGYLVGKDDSELGKMVGKVAWSALKNETVGAYNSPHPTFNLAVATATGLFGDRTFDLTKLKPVVPDYLHSKYYGHPEKQINEMVGPLAGLMSRVIPGVSPITVNYYLNQVLGGAPARAEELLGYSSYLAHANRGASGLLPDIGDTLKSASKLVGKRFETINTRYVKEIEEIAKEALGDYNADKRNKTKEARKCVATAAELVMQSYKQLYWAQTTEEGRREVVKTMSGEAKRWVDRLSGRVYKGQRTSLNRQAKRIKKQADRQERGQVDSAPKAWSGLIGE